MAFYGSLDYWNKRYQATANQPPVEWYRTYSSLRHLLNPISFSVSNHHGDNKNNNTENNKAPQKLSTLHPNTTTTTSSVTSNNTQMNVFPKQQQVGGVGTTTTPVVTNWSFPSRNESSVLIIGCGNSVFGEDMIRDGWTGRIVQIDFSQIVIDQMKEKYNNDEIYSTTTLKSNHHNKKGSVVPSKNASGTTTTGPPTGTTTTTGCVKNRMEFLCIDATDEIAMMKTFQSASFDLIICKGTFDAILSTSTPTIKIQKLVRQCYRILDHKHGIFVVVTNGSPDNRLEYLEYENNINYYWQGVNIHSMNAVQNKSIVQQHRQQRLSSSSSSLSSTSNRSTNTGVGEKNVYVYVCRKRYDTDGSTQLPIGKKSSMGVGIVSIVGKENASAQRGNGC